MLTEAGLSGIVAAIREGRLTFQRILTYALNSIIKKVVQVLFLAVGLIMTHRAILTSLLMVILMITGDLLAMSLTTDDVQPSPTPNVWDIGSLTTAGVIMGTGDLVLCTAVLAVRSLWRTKGDQHEQDKLNDVAIIDPQRNRLHPTATAAATAATATAVSGFPTRMIYCCGLTDHGNS